MRTFVSTLAVLALAASATPQPKLKVIVDQDARGPCTTDIQAILMFVQSPDVELLGITVVSGDLWLEQEVRHTLRALELAGRTDIPVYRGAVFPLVQTQEEASGWEVSYGEQPYQGAWEGELGPYETVPLREGEPSIRAAEGHAANVIVDMVNRYPGEVHLWSGGPLTNFALALALDPTLPEKVKALTVMGGGVDVARYRREFNWWWDPEAARIVLRAPWKELTITPVDISVKTHHSVLDPSIITSSREMYIDVDIDHGIHYGFTLAWELDQHQTPGVPSSTVQFDLDAERFYDLYVELMTRPY